MSSFTAVFIFSIATHQSLSLEWIFNPKLAENVDIGLHGEMLDSKLSLADNPGKTGLSESETENDHKTRSGGGRGLKFPNISDADVNNEGLIPKSSRLSKQFSLVPYSDLIKSRTASTSCKFSDQPWDWKLILMRYWHCSFFSAGPEWQHPPI